MIRVFDGSVIVKSDISHSTASSIETEGSIAVDEVYGVRFNILRASASDFNINHLSTNTIAHNALKPLRIDTIHTTANPVTTTKTTIVRPLRSFQPEVKSDREQHQSTPTLTLTNEDVNE